MTIDPIKPDAAQLVECRAFLAAEIARMYDVPRHLIQRDQRALRNVLEHRA